MYFSAASHQIHYKNGNKLQLSKLLHIPHILYYFSLFYFLPSRMAEALISVLLGQLTSITCEWTIQEVRLLKDVKKDVSSLKSKLEAIQVVLEDAEKKQLDDAGVRRWLDQLKHVSYDMDNVLDEWSTEIVKSRIQKLVDEEEGDHRHNAIVSNKKVFFSLPTSCFCLTRLKQVGIRREIAVKIKELNETLDGIAKERRDYSLETTKVIIPKGRETTSLVDESKVHGRDGDKDFIISKLLCNNSHGDKGLVIIPIVGMGGIGKTTLAQLAFSDAKVKAHFDERIWVCVSEPFDEIQIAKAILEALKRNCQNLDTLENLLQCIRESTEGKKFLLVLDDVWSDDREKWEQLEQSLKYGALGSRIIVTTRKKEVAIVMGTATQMINLALLSEEHCWLIFSRLAFWERNSEECKHLEEIGRKIARKCKGLPLVAKTLGGLMCFKETKMDWEDVLSSRIWESQDDNIRVFIPFLLSYYDLPPLEKRCFSFCSVFPKDYVFHTDDLIELWMSQGYLSCNENPEKAGRNCFKNLTMRSFFQDFVKDHDGRILRCKMHDILHDFAQFLTRNECATMNIDEQKTKPLSLEKVRHSTLMIPDLGEEFPTSIFSESNLRSLFIICSDRGGLVDSTMFFRGTSRLLKYLRTLNLSRCRIAMLPEQLGELRHLRYLNLSYNQFTELPDEVCDLCNLQTLRIEFCNSLERLPEGMGKLVSLRHLHIGCNSRLEGLPKGLGRLTRLRTLDTLVIPENDEEYLGIGDLAKFNHLRLESVLQIMGCGHLKNLGDVEKVERLMNRNNLVELNLTFRLNYHPENSLEDEFMILDALQPHPRLKVLVIHGYVGVNLTPKWMMSLVNLTNLHLILCNTCETLPPLGSLPSLELLVMYEMSNVRKIGREFMGITTNDGIVANGDEDDKLISFPKLKRLEFWKMNRLEEWEDCESGTNSSLIIMPCLNVLDIYYCDILISLPEFFKVVPLKDLTIIGCPQLSKSFQQSSKEWDKISHIPNIFNDFNKEK